MAPIRYTEPLLNNHIVLPTLISSRGQLDAAAQIPLLHGGNMNAEGYRFWEEPAPACLSPHAERGKKGNRRTALTCAVLSLLETDENLSAVSSSSNGPRRRPAFD
jgi:hypothetical protein